MARAGLSQAEIAAQLQVARPTVCFHMRNLGIPAREALGRRFDWAAIRAYNLTLLCPNCHSQTDTRGGRNKARRGGLPA